MRKQADPEVKMASIAPFGLRLKPDLKSHLEEAARLNNRSLNSEIVARLEESLVPDFVTPNHEERLVDHEKRIVALETRLGIKRREKK